jgi:hypothetical protein
MYLPTRDGVLIVVIIALIAIVVFVLLWVAGVFG